MSLFLVLLIMIHSRAIRRRNEQCCCCAHWLAYHIPPKLHIIRGIPANMSGVAPGQGPLRVAGYPQLMAALSGVFAVEEIIQCYSAARPRIVNSVPSTLCLLRVHSYIKISCKGPIFNIALFRVSNSERADTYLGYRGNLATGIRGLTKIWRLSRQPSVVQLCGVRKTAKRVRVFHVRTRFFGI